MEVVSDCRIDKSLTFLRSTLLRLVKLQFHNWRKQGIVSANLIISVLTIVTKFENKNTSKELTF